MSKIDKNLEKSNPQAILEVQAENGCGNTKEYRDKSGITAFHPPAWTSVPFDTGNPDDKVFVKDMISLAEIPRLGFGIMEVDHTTFEWTLRYNEAAYIIDGPLEILIEDRKIVGNTGDVIFLPAGPVIKFSASKIARFLYVISPVN